MSITNDMQQQRRLTMYSESVAIKIMDEWNKIHHLRMALIKANRWNHTTKSGCDRRWNALRQRSRDAGLM